MSEILIIGSGIIGGYTAARLFENGAKVSLLARGEKAERFEKDGLKLRDGLTGAERTVHLPIVREPIENLAPVIQSIRPDHIHMGGSVKKGMISPEFLARLKKELDCTISVFYGDARYSTYHNDLSHVVDHIYVTNKTHVRENRSGGIQGKGPGSIKVPGQGLFNFTQPASALLKLESLSEIHLILS